MKSSSKLAHRLGCSHVPYSMCYIVPVVEMISRGKIISMFENKKKLNDHGYAKDHIKVTMHLQALPQNIPSLWQLIYHKYIVYIPELLRCRTIIMVNFN